MTRKITFIPLIDVGLPSNPKKGKLIFIQRRNFVYFSFYLFFYQTLLNQLSGKPGETIEISNLKLATVHFKVFFFRK